MLKSYKYRINPTEAQASKIEQSFSICRLVYNLALQTKIDCYNANGTKLSAFDLCYQLVELKKEYKWIKEVDSQALQAAVKKMDISFRNFFRGNGYPRYKSKRSKQSFQCPNGKRELNFSLGLLTIPKIQNISIVVSRNFKGKIKTITISKTTTNKYYASILVDNGKQHPNKKAIKEKSSVGIDLGIKHFAVLSDGTKIDNPKFLKTDLNKLKLLQRRLSRKNKESKNRDKARLKVALLHEKIANRRSDFLHKLSTAITKQYNTICVESLNVSGMIKNKRIAQAISDVSWSEFLTQLKYKCEWYGKNILELPRFYASSKICNNCGVKNETLILSDREWTCSSCGTLHDRDISAAKNIKDYFFKTEGHSGLACGVIGNSRDDEAGILLSTKETI